MLLSSHLHLSVYKALLKHTSAHYCNGALVKIQHCTAVHCTILLCITLQETSLHCTALHCIALYFTAVRLSGKRLVQSAWYSWDETCGCQQTGCNSLFCFRCHSTNLVICFTHPLKNYRNLDLQLCVGKIHSMIL